MRWRQQLFGRKRLYDDLSEELRQHIEERVDDLIEQGAPRDQAVAQARREFGNLASLEQSSREVWQWPRLESVLFDIRYALRQLRLQPSFAIVAVLILAIGIGANTTVFSVVDKLLLQPLPFRDSDRLAWVINFDSPGLSGRTHRVSTLETLTEVRSFESITAYEAFFARSSYKLTGELEPDRVKGVMVPANFFPFLGVSPLLGRPFTEEECQKGGPGASILSYSLWQRRYSGDPKVIGRELVVNDHSTTIVGVLPQSFDFGAVFAPGVNIEIYMPAVYDVLRYWGNTMAIMGRLKPGVSLSAAQEEATALIAHRQQERPDLGEPGSYNAILQPFHEAVIGKVRQPMLILWAAVGLVLLIVCVNLSNLLLAARHLTPERDGGSRSDRSRRISPRTPTPDREFRVVAAGRRLGRCVRIWRHRLCSTAARPQHSYAQERRH